MIHRHFSFNSLLPLPRKREKKKSTESRDAIRAVIVNHQKNLKEKPINASLLLIAEESAILFCFVLFCF